MLVNMDPIKLTALFTLICFIHEMTMLPNFPFFLFFFFIGEMGKATWAIGQRPLRHKLVLID